MPLQPISSRLRDSFGRSRVRVFPLNASALLMLGVPVAAQAPPATTTPIEHLIVVVGENLSFDNLFGTYQPKSGAAVHNLLSEGIVNADGSPGPHFAKAAQRRAEVRDAYAVTPHVVGTYDMLPQPGTTYAVGQSRNVADKRFPELLPNGPFQITRHVDYTAYVGDPVHRFFQMWQQIDGGRRDLFVWVAETSGEGSQNRTDPASGTNQGAIAMRFNNMAARHRACHRVLARRRIGAAAAEPDRGPEPAPRHKQLVHAIGLRERLVHQVLEPERARDCGDPQLSRVTTVSKLQ